MWITSLNCLHQLWTGGCIISVLLKPGDSRYWIQGLTDIKWKGQCSKLIWAQRSFIWPLLYKVSPSDWRSLSVPHFSFLEFFCHFNQEYLSPFVIHLVTSLTPQASTLFLIGAQSMQMKFNFICYVLMSLLLFFLLPFLFKLFPIFPFLLVYLTFSVGQYPCLLMLFPCFSYWIHFIYRRYIKMVILIVPKLRDICAVTVTSMF